MESDRIVKAGGEQLPNSYVSRAEARTVVCPTCGAKAGAKCVGSRGKARESVHRDRMNAVAQQTGGHQTRTLALVGNTLVDHEGNEVGRVTSVELELDVQGPIWEGRGGTYGGGVGGDVEVDVLSNSLETPPSGSAEGEQTTLVPDPVEEVFEHYQRTLERPRATLTPKVRRWISDAVQAVGIEQCKAAISGLAVSEHHRQGGYIGIEYALRPKANETIEGRIEMMAAKAPARTLGGGPTVAELLATVPSEAHGIVRDRMSDVVRLCQSPDHEGARRIGEESLRLLREHTPHIEPVIVDGKLTGWRKVAS